MPSVDPKPQHRPFRRVLYRQESQDSTVVQDVSPRSDGHLLGKLRKNKPFRPRIEDGHVTAMNKTSTKLLMREGILYRAPHEKIKYVQRVRNDPMARYLFQMKKYSNSSLGISGHSDNHSFP